ncbi:MAG TPA: hypothetical protein DIW54_11545 [Chitinophagaceae bacterium]|nr:hypothetical protein [Chitinophagaceae bacterium]HCT23914.1 hypothetical protein [Chitinophagaceae bacterium]
MKYSFLLTTVIASIVLYSCSKKTIPAAYDPNVKSELTIEFDNVVGNQQLQLNTGTYTNANNEQFTVSLLQYFISNVKLKKMDGTEYVVPQDSAYFLIRERDAATHKIRLKVPEGEYHSLSFVLGVDSLRNTKPLAERKGVLDPASYSGEESMYWSWNSGYIFYKMEGNSPAAPADGAGNRKFRYHIGLFGGMTAPTINNIKNISLSLMDKGMPKVKTGKTPNVHLLVDILKMFNGGTNVSITTNSTVMVTPFSAVVANNYQNMFTHDHTEN